MCLCYGYDISWASMLISSAIPILPFMIPILDLAPNSEGQGKLSLCESGV